MFGLVWLSTGLRSPHSPATYLSVVVPAPGSVVPVYTSGIQARFCGQVKVTPEVTDHFELFSRGFRQDIHSSTLHKQYTTKHDELWVIYLPCISIHLGSHRRSAPSRRPPEDAETRHCSLYMVPPPAKLLITSFSTASRASAFSSRSVRRSTSSSDSSSLL